MSKYQEALKRLKTNEYLTSREQRQYYNLLQELVDKEKIYDELTNELGCPLEMVLKALLNGIYCIHEIGERNYYSGTELNISGNHEALVVYENNVYWITRNGERIKQQRTIYKRFEFKDYKQTWWLRSDWRNML